MMHLVVLYGYQGSDSDLALVGLCILWFCMVFKVLILMLSNFR